MFDGIGERPGIGTEDREAAEGQGRACRRGVFIGGELGVGLGERNSWERAVGYGSGPAGSMGFRMDEDVACMFVEVSGNCGFRFSRWIRSGGTQRVAESQRGNRN